MQSAFHRKHTRLDTRKLINVSFQYMYIRRICHLLCSQGSKEPRLKGDEHMAVVEEFCLAVKKKWPNCLVQFEDFQTDRAFAILQKMRHKLLCFNDDIQGTGAVVTTG